MSYILIYKKMDTLQKTELSSGGWVPYSTGFPH